MVFSAHEEAFVRLLRCNTTSREELKRALELVNPNAIDYFVLNDGSKSTTTYSLLMYASHFRNFEAFKLLLENGADLNMRNNRGTTVHQFMEKRNQTEWKRYCQEFVPGSTNDRVIKSSDKSRSNGKQLRPDSSRTTNETEPYEFGDKERAFLELIKKPSSSLQEFRSIRDVNVNASTLFTLANGEKSTTTYSLLMYAAHHRNFSAFKFLIDMGADVNWKNNRGTTVFKFLEKRNITDWIERCQISANNQVISNNREQEQYLNTDGGFGSNEYKFLQMIINGQAKAKSDFNVNAYTYFITKSGEKSTTTYSLLMFACHHQNLDAFKYLINHGADMTWRNNTGTTVMGMLAKRGLLQYAKVCKEKFPETKSKRQWVQFLNTGNHNGWSPLHASMHNNQTDFTTWLVENDAGITDDDDRMDISHDASLKTTNRNAKKTLLGLIMNDFEDNMEKKCENEGVKSLLENAFRDKIDCKTMIFNPEREDIQDYLNDIVKIMRKDNEIGLGFIVILSAGIENSLGLCFMTSRGYPIYIKNDVIDRFAIERCPELQDKQMVFITSIYPTLGNQQYLERNIELTSVRNPVDHLWINVRSEGSLAFKRQSPPIALTLLASAIKRYGANYSVEDFIQQTAKEFFEIFINARNAEQSGDQCSQWLDYRNKLSRPTFFKEALH